MKTKKIASAIIDRDGPFSEFKQDASVVSVKLQSGKVYRRILLLYPDIIIGMKGYKDLPFETNEILEVYQDDVDLSLRGKKDYLFP